MTQTSDTHMLRDPQTLGMLKHIIATERIYQQYRWGLKCSTSGVFYEVAGGTYFDYAVYCRDYLTEAINKSARGDLAGTTDNIRKIAALSFAAIELIGMEDRDALFKVIDRLEPARTFGNYSPATIADLGVNAVLFKLQELLNGSKLPNRQLFLELAHLCLCFMPGNVQPRTFTTITNGRNGQTITAAMQEKELERYMNRSGS